MNYEHKGIEIKFLEGTGQFFAKVSGQDVFGPSLATVKKKIDKANAFPSFTVLIWRGGSVKRETVVGKREDKFKYREPDIYYKLAGGGEERPQYLYRDTPENEQKLNALISITKRHREEQLAFQARQSAESDAARKDLVNLKEKESA